MTVPEIPEEAVQPGRRWVNVLLGGGLAASVVSFIYPAIRYIIPPPVAESTSRSVVAAKVGRTQKQHREDFQIWVEACPVGADGGWHLSRLHRGLYTLELHGSISRRPPSNLVRLPQRTLRSGGTQRERPAPPAPGSV